MLKKTLAILLCSLLLLLLSACSEANELKLSMVEDGTESLDLIHIFGEEQYIYVSGGIMMIEINKEPKQLELALHDENLTAQDIIDQAIEDSEDKDVETKEYPDGSVEYYYDSFTLVRMNTVKGDRNLYFVPADKGYYDVAK